MLNFAGYFLGIGITLLNSVLTAGFVLQAPGTRRRLLPVFVLWLLFFSAYLAYNVSWGFGPAVWSCCAMIPLSLVMIITLAMKAKPTIVFLVVGLQLLPWVGVYGINTACNAINKATGAFIVDALDQYRSDRGVYPESLEELVPQYLENIPGSICAVPGAFLSMMPEAEFYFSGFRLVDCGPGPSVLMINDVTLLGVERFNLQTRSWSYMMVSFDGGPCEEWP